MSVYSEYLHHLNSNYGHGHAHSRHHRHTEHIDHRVGGYGHRHHHSGPIFGGGLYPIPFNHPDYAPHHEHHGHHGYAHLDNDHGPEFNIAPHWHVGHPYAVSERVQIRLEDGTEWLATSQVPSNMDIPHIGALKTPPTWLLVPMATIIDGLVNDSLNNDTSEMPALPADAGTVNYELQSVAGVPTWVAVTGTTAGVNLI